MRGEIKEQGEGDTGTSATTSDTEIARNSHQPEGGGGGSAGVPFKPLLPPEQQPPLDLNKEIMECFRPLMRKDDLKDKPNFQ